MIRHGIAEETELKQGRDTLDDLSQLLKCGLKSDAISFHFNPGTW